MCSAMPPTFACVTLASYNLFDLGQLFHGGTLLSLMPPMPLPPQGSKCLKLVHVKDFSALLLHTSVIFKLGAGG